MYGERTVTVSSEAECANFDKALQLKDLKIKVILKRPIQEINVKLAKNKKIFLNIRKLEKGFNAFKDFSIIKDINSKLDFSKCFIKISPEFNPNIEKLTFNQHLFDSLGFRFDQKLTLVSISGTQSVEYYQTIIRSLTYSITNYTNDSEKLKLVLNKKFFITCLRSESNIETNTVLIQLNLAKKQFDFDILYHEKQIQKVYGISGFKIDNLENNFYNISTNIRSSAS